MGIYAIHEHPYVRNWFWDIMSFEDKALYDTLIYIPYAIFACAIVFVVCSSIELVRLKIFDFFTRIFSTAKDFLTANKE